MKLKKDGVYFFVSIMYNVRKDNRIWYARIPNLKEVNGMLIDKRTKNIIDNI